MSDKDPFDLLGIPAAFDVDMSVAEQRHRDLSRVLHPDRYVSAPPRERRLSLTKAIDVNEAFRVVKDPVRRAEALLRRAGVAVHEGAWPKPGPDFLMDLMEQREALADARRKGDRARIERLAEAVRAWQKASVARLSGAFAGMNPHPAGAQPAISSTPDVARKVMLAVAELRYCERFLEEVVAVEDQMLDHGATLTHAG